MDSKCRAYFEVWNKHDTDGIKAMLSPDATLRDWDIEKKGAEEVANANGAIFAAVPGIKIEVLKMHPSEGTHVCTCEILVRLNDAAGTVLKVVDIIEFNEDHSLIVAVRAFKG